MAVTSSTSNFMTLIQENGSQPTGAGGAIINNNFLLLDNQFVMGTGSSSESSWCAKNATYANFASNAGTASYANAAGTVYSAPDASYAYSAYSAGYAPPVFNTNMAAYSTGDAYYAVYGSLKEMYYSTVSGSTYCTDPAECSALPPFGPFMVDALICLYPWQSSSEVIYAKALICGWNLDIQKISIQEAWNASGTAVTLGAAKSVNTVSEVAANMLYFGVSNNRLMLCYGDTGRKWVGHIASRMLYPSDYDMGNSSSGS